MSRRRQSRNKKEELNKEYKDPNITGDNKVVDDSYDTEDKNLVSKGLSVATKELTEEKDKEIIDYLNKSIEKNSIYGTMKEEEPKKAYEVITTKYPVFIKSTKSLTSRALLVGELDDIDRNRYFSNCPGYTMAFLPANVQVEVIDEGEGWYRLRKGYIYNQSVAKNKEAETLLSKDRYLSRMDDINKLIN